MPANKNALIHYKTIDNCLHNCYRHWTLEDLVDACSDALYDSEGIRKGISVRTVQGRHTDDALRQTRIQCPYCGVR